MNIAMITIDTCLANEVGGIDRFPYIANLLCARGHKVDLITSCFHHWKKEQRRISDKKYENTPYRIIFVDEPSYNKNIDPKRIYAYHIAAGNIRDFLEGKNKYVKPPENGYDLIYVNIPPNNIALTAAKFASARQIPIIGDINDLWPEAMRMVIDIPIISDICFLPLRMQAEGIYKRLDGAIATSNEYAERPFKSKHKDSLTVETVYVGTDLRDYDDEAERQSTNVEKNDNEIWFTYAGTIGTSYDIETVIKAMRIVKARSENNKSLDVIRVKIIGDGPDRERLENLTRNYGLQDVIEFTGYVPHGLAAAYLKKSDVALNTFIAKAPQSIPTKIADYLAGGCAIINTSGSYEMRKKLIEYGSGVTIEAENPGVFADTMCSLTLKSDALCDMKQKARIAAERYYDRRNTYLKIVEHCEKIGDMKKRIE